MEFDEKHNESEKGQLFSKKKKKLNIGITGISCIIAMVTRIKYFETSPLSYIVMNPCFYFMIFESLNSLRQKFILFSFFCQNRAIFHYSQCKQLAKIVLFLRRPLVFSIMMIHVFIGIYYE